jgi:hypothetical protein
MTPNAYTTDTPGQRRELAAAGRFRTLSLVLAGLLCLLISACGVKKLPVAPGAVAPGAVTGLQYQLQRNQVTLAWPTLKGDAAGSRGLGGFYIYMAQYPLDQQECANCPLLFRRIGQIGEAGLYENGLPRENFSFIWTIAPGYHYAFKVMAMGKDGQLGLESNTVAFDFSAP